MPVCAGCGCSDGHACPGGCHWVRPEYCSACFGRDTEKIADAATEWRRRRRKNVRNPKPHVTALQGRTFRIEIDGDRLGVRDHIGLLIFAMSPHGYSMLPHYEAADLLPLFAYGEAPNG